MSLWKLVWGQCPACGGKILLHVSTLLPHSRWTKTCAGCQGTWEIRSSRRPGQDDEIRWAQAQRGMIAR